MKKASKLKTRKCSPQIITVPDDTFEDDSENYYEAIIATNLEPASQNEFRIKHQNQAEQVRSLSKSADEGNADAIVLLHHLAKITTQALCAIKPDNDTVRSIAHDEHYWPILMPDYRKTQKDPRLEYLSKLELGRSLSLDAKRFLKNESDVRLLVEYAIDIITRVRGPSISTSPVSLILDRRRITRLGLTVYNDHTVLHQNFRSLVPKFFALEPLTNCKKNIACWCEAVREVILFETKGDPVSSEFNMLRSIGKFRERHGEAKPGSRTAECNIKEGLFMRIEEALRKIVRKHPLTS